jgi:hypothetical protein
MVEAKIAQASVKEAENGLLKLEWVSENMFVVKPYFIRKGMLEDFATETRQALKRLVDKYVQIDKENSNRQTGEPGELYRAGKELKELAERGHDLYKSLFNAVEGDANAEKMKKWLSEQTKEGQQLQIRLSIDSGIYVPWGLIYDGDPNSLRGAPEDDEIELYRDFWCLKHKLSSVYNRILLASMSESSPGGPVNLLPVMDKQVYDKVTSQWNKYWNDEDKITIDSRSKILTWLNETFERSLVHTSADFYKRWRLEESNPRLLYFYCHANGSNIALGDEQITANHFIVNTKLPDTARGRASCVVFFNGCDTALGDPKGGFLEATGESVFCGFIGTETKVPDVFAFRFGLDFLYYFLGKGWPVSKVMDYLRNDHWPLSLIYSTYCPPFLSLGPINDPLALDLKGNFSRIPLLVGDSSI